MPSFAEVGLQIINYEAWSHFGFKKSSLEQKAVDLEF